MRVRADLNISLDGRATTEGGTAENPMGDDWLRLVAAYLETRTVQEQVFGDTSGKGTTGVDEKYAVAYFEGTGSEIMGAGMFGLHLYPNDPEWRGWWGPNPPFHFPVYVLTHEPRPILEMEGGTTFHFLSAAPKDVLALAVEAAGGKDVRVGGGPTVVRSFLQEDLIDELHVAIAPIILGRGICLWDDLRELDLRYSARSEVAESGVIHLTFKR